MDERINELESIALAVRAKKGRMDSSSREKASALLASIWADTSIDPAPTLKVLEDLKAEAIAEALRSCWPLMDIGRKNQFRKWVPSPSAEKSYRRLALFVSSIIEIDGATALHWLGLLIPPGRTGLSKGSRELLASILLGERVLSFDVLLREGRSTELLRISAALYDIAADPSLSISAMTRSRLASAILHHLAGLDAQEDNLAVSDLRAKISSDAKKWPLALRNQVISASEIRHETTTAPAALDAGAGVQSEEQARKPETNASTSSPLTIGSLQQELPRLGGELRDRISAMTREVGLLRRAQDCIAKLVETTERIEVQREAAIGELQRVQELLKLAESERDRANADAMREAQRANEFAAAMGQMKVDAESERKRLGQQISANANGRIEEFKNRLGRNLSRLVVDLPGKHAQVSAELGRVLLLQFHQFLDALSQEGIETISTRLGSS